VSISPKSVQTWLNQKNTSQITFGLSILQTKELLLCVCFSHTEQKTSTLDSLARGYVVATMSRLQPKFNGMAFIKIVVTSWTHCTVGRSLSACKFHIIRVSKVKTSERTDKKKQCVTYLKAKPKVYVQSKTSSHLTRCTACTCRSQGSGT